MSRAQDLVNAYRERFRIIRPGLEDGIETLYREDLHFTDPVTTVRGLDQYSAYLEHFGKQAEGALVEDDGEVVGDTQAAVFWTMVLPPRGGSKPRPVAGISRLYFDERIFQQRDYFDLGEAIYEHLPGLGWIARKIKFRLAPRFE